MKKFVLENSETRFQSAETRFQKAKLPCPAFSLQGIGWIPQKKEACLRSICDSGCILFALRDTVSLAKVKPLRVTLKLEKNRLRPCLFVKLRVIF